MAGACSAQRAAKKVSLTSSVLDATTRQSATRRGPHPLAAGICTVLGTLPMLWLVNANVAAVPALTVVFAFLSGALSGTVGPNMRCGVLVVCCF